MKNNSSNHGYDGDDEDDNGDDETPVSRHPAASGIFRGGEVVEETEEEGEVENSIC